MNGADWFDLGLLVLPRWVARAVLLVLFVATGGGCALWYATETTEDLGETLTTYTDGLLADPSTPALTP
jgi:hypothetical protein